MAEEDDDVEKNDMSKESVEDVDRPQTNSNGVA